MLTLLVLLGPPLVMSCLHIVLRPCRRAAGWIGVAASALSFVGSIVLCVEVIRQGQVPAGVKRGDVWRVDALSAVLALCISFVALLASALGPGIDHTEDHDVAQARRFRIFMNAFAFTMLVAVTIQNVALMWVAIEATTITSAIVIPLHRTKASVEASWKYILICSVGIALAFAGTVLAYFDFF